MNRLTAVLCMSSLLAMPAANAQRAAVDLWKTELQSAGYTAIYPPRSGDGAGTVLAFDGSGNEIVVLDGRSCVPKLMPTRQTVTLLSRMQTYQVGASLMARAGGLLKGKVDINGIVEGSKDKLVSFAANDVFTDRYETARWRAEILKLSPDSMCFKVMTSDKHMLVFQAIGAKGARLLLTDKSGAGLKFTAEVLKLGSVSPALAAQVEGLSDLVIESPMFIGYRAVQFKYLPGLFEPDVEVRELDLADIEAIRASAASR